MIGAPQQSYLGFQPFAIGQGKPFQDSRPWNGGWIRVLVGPIGANANYQITHGLRTVPRFCLLLDVGVNTGFTNPIPRGASAWNTASIYLNLPAVATGTTVVLLIG